MERIFFAQNVGQLVKQQLDSEYLSDFVWLYQST